MDSLTALWNELILDACASDGPIRDADVKEAVRRYRPKIEAALRPADASGGGEGLRTWIASMKMAAVYPDGRPAPNGYEGGWNDALDEVIGHLAATPPAPTPTVAAFLCKYDGYFDHRTVELGDLRKFAATAERPAEPTGEPS